MLKITFINPGMSTTVQDKGRIGYRYYGVPQSGYMDDFSAKLANLIIGQNEHQALIEFTYQGAKMHFDSDCQIALTGADLAWSCDGQKIERNSLINIHAGQIITGSYSRSGMYAYLAVKGMMSNIQNDIGSYSSYSYAELGGFNGRSVQKTDQLIIHTKAAPIQSLNIHIEGTSLDADCIRLSKGPEFDTMKQSDRDSFTKKTYRKSPQTDRMGSRLDHRNFDTQDKQLKNSRPVCPGIIQLLPSGQLIVLLQDGQTTGGYPRIGYIGLDELNKFNQIRIGREFKFEF